MNATARESLETREALLRAAKHIFFEKGFNGATVKEIADAANSNVSLVSYHFEGKEGLYKACFEDFGKAMLARAERILKAPTSVEDLRVRLQLFVEELYQSHLDEPELTGIAHRECSSSLDFIREVFRTTFVRVFEALSSFIGSAQKAGLLRAELNPHISAVLFFGSMIHPSRMDSVHKELFGLSLVDPKYREQVTQHIVTNFLTGVLK